MNYRNTQKLLWVDVAFVNKLNEIRAKRTLVGKPVKNLGYLTRELIESPAFKKLEQELLAQERDMINDIKVRYDGFFR